MIPSLVALLWTCQDPKPKVTIELKDHAAVQCVRFSPDGSLLASALSSFPNDPQTEVPEVKLWDSATGKELRTLAGHTAAIDAVTFSPDGKTLASGGVDRLLRLWDVASGKPIRVLTGAGGRIFDLVFRNLFTV